MMMYRVGQIKRGQCSVFHCSIKAPFREFEDFLAGEITLHLRTLRGIKI